MRELSQKRREEIDVWVAETVTLLLAVVEPLLTGEGEPVPLRAALQIAQFSFEVGLRFRDADPRWPDAVKAANFAVANQMNDVLRERHGPEGSAFMRSAVEMLVRERGPATEAVHDSPRARRDRW